MRISDWSSDVCSSDLCNGFRLALQASLDPKSPHPRMSKRQRRIAVKAIAVLSACASVGLEGLIDEATGHQYEQYEASEAAPRAKLGATPDEGQTPAGESIVAGKEGSGGSSPGGRRTKK